MKIKFKVNDYGGFEEFPIVGIQYQFDSNGIPVDIAIAASEEILVNIAEFSSIGYNIRELSYDEDYKLVLRNATHEALYARLIEFSIEDAKGVVYY